MNSIDLLKMGAGNLLKRKFRTFLTTLSIVIGTLAVIVMVSLGIGLQESVSGQIMNIGGLNEITIYPKFDEASAAKGKKMKLLEKSDFDKLMSIEGVDAVTPVISTSVKLISGRFEARTNVYGIEPLYMRKLNLEVETGRVLHPGDTAKILFGGRTKRFFYLSNNSKTKAKFSDKEEVDLFNNKLDMTFNMQPSDFKDSGNSNLIRMSPVGILKESGGEYDYSIYMPIDELERLIKSESTKVASTEAASAETSEEKKSSSKKVYSEAKLLAKDSKNVKVISTQIKAMGYDTRSLNDELESIQNVFKIVQVVFGGIGAISLLIAGIGITNTMVMAIYERKKEIGVMKVIGASIDDIKRLFLLEAGLIGLLGGVVGILISMGISTIANLVANSIFASKGITEKITISSIPPWLIISSIIFTFFIGVISGYLPAKKAMKLSALEAIKSE